MSEIAGRLRAAAGMRGNSRGALLIEVLIALAILGVIAVVFIGAVYTALHAARIAEERSIGLTLAKSQIEFVKTLPYSDNDWEYTLSTTEADYVTKPSWWDANTPPLLGTEYEGYSVQVGAISNIDTDLSGTPDDGIRTITATSFREGRELFTLQNYEVHR